MCFHQTTSVWNSWFTTMIKEQKFHVLHYLEFAFSMHVGVTIFVTTGLPTVRVPVLSNTTVFTMANFSRMFPPRKSSPLLAPKEVPTW